MKTRDLDRIRFVTRHFNDLQGLRYWVPLGLITLSGGGTTYFQNRPLVLLRAALFVGAFLLMLVARRYYRKTLGEVERQAVHLTAVPHAVSVFSPAGPAPRLEGSQPGAPVAQRFLLTMGLALVLFLLVQAISPAVRIDVDESLVQPPWHTRSVVFSFGSGLPISVSTAKAWFAQTMYVLYGSFFLGVWLWRERRLSQSYYLALGALLLSLSAVGASLGFFVGEDGGIASFVSSLRPAVVHLWIALLLCGSSMVLVGLVDHWQLVWTLRRRPASREDER